MGNVVPRVAAPTQAPFGAGPCGNAGRPADCATAEHSAWQHKIAQMGRALDAEFALEMLPAAK